MGLEKTKDPNKKPKVMHLVLGPRSDTPLLQNLIKGLKNKGFDQLVCFLTGDAAENSLLHAMEIETVSAGFNKKTLKKMKPGAIKKIKNIILENKIDIVHPQRHKPTMYGTFASWLAGPHVRVITTVHGRNRTRNLKRKLLNKIIFKRIDYIIGVSQAVCQDIIVSNKSIQAEKVRCVYNGIEAEKFCTSEIDRIRLRTDLGITNESGILIGTIGRLAPVKGHKILIEAFSDLFKKNQDIYLVIWGEGEERESLEKVILQSKFEDRIKLPGYSSDIPSCLHAMDLFVLPSLSEGHPLALLEAMAASLPVVATSVGGIPEILSDVGENLLVPPEDVKHLSGVIEEILLKPKIDRDKLGKNLQSLVKQNYSVRHMVDDTARCYMEMMCQEV